MGSCAGAAAAAAAAEARSQMQACDYFVVSRVLPLTPNINVFRARELHAGSFLAHLLRCAPLLCRIEVQTLVCLLDSFAPQLLQALRSLPQSITWQPLNLRLEGQAQSTVLDLCAAFASTPLAQAVSKITLDSWQVEPPIAALRATFPNMLHFELWGCNQITASSLSEAVAAWPMLHSIMFTAYNVQEAQDSQQPLEAAARIAAELKAGQPFEVVLRVYFMDEGDAARMDVLVAAIHNAGGGKVDVRWVRL